jgi:DNA-binding MarR family transcriptional regulator
VYDEALRPSGLKGTQFNQLVVLAIAKTPTVKRLAEILAVDRTSLTRSLAPLERDGLITNVPSEDGRERKLVLTDLGRRRLKDATKLWAQAQQRVAEVLGPLRGGALTKSLKAVEDAFRVG